MQRSHESESDIDHYLAQELRDLVRSDPRIFKFLQDATLDGLWYWDLENPEFEWMNEGFWELLGYDPASKQHLASEWQNLIHPEDLQTALDNLTKHCEDPNHPYDQVVRYTHKDGSTVWVRCRGLAMRNDDGKPTRLLGAHNNITELMRVQGELQRIRNLLEQTVDERTRELQNTNVALADSLKQLDTVHMELQHRVKNSLQVVVSLLNLRSDRAQESVAKKSILEASRRIEALSLAHSFFYHPDFENQAALLEFIPALCKMLGDAYAIEENRIEVRIDVAPMTIPLSKITPVSLILNELVSNAFKHAFPANGRGSISIRSQDESVEQGLRVGYLCVADDGIGLPDNFDFDTATSTGLVVFRSLVDQIDGTVEIDRRQGTTIHVRFPLEV